MADAPLAYYRLDDTSSTMADTSASALNGSYGASVVRGKPSLVATNSNPAAGFPGGTYSATGIATVPRNPTLEPANLTLETLVRENAAPGAIVELLAYGPGGGQAWSLRLSATNTLTARVLTTAGTFDVLGTTQLALNTTYHVAMTYDGTAARLYVNGALEASTSGTGSLSYASAAAAGLGVGGSQNSLRTVAFNGSLDEVAIYGSALSAARITSHYTAATTMPTPVDDPYAAAVTLDSPTAYYRLDDPGSALVDATLNHLNGSYGPSVTHHALTLVAGTVDYSTRFPGTQATVGTVATVAQDSLLQPSSAITVETWTRETVAPTTAIDVVSYGDQHGQGYSLQITNTNHAAFALSLNGVGTVVVTGGSALSSVTTYHLVGTYDGTTVKVYVNGVLDGSATQPGTIAYAGIGSYGLSIGGGQNTTRNTISGKVDETAIYSNALTPQRIASHYAAGAPPAGIPGQIVQSSTNSLTAPPNTTLTWSRVPTAGDLLLAVVRWNSSGTVASSGWAALDATTSQLVNGTIFYRVAGPNEPQSVTFSASSSQGWPMVTGMEISGVNQSAPFNAHAIAGNVPSASYASRSLTPSVGGTLPIAIFDTGEGNGAVLQATSGWPNAYTDTQGVTSAFVGPIAGSSLSPIGVTVTATGPLSHYGSFSWIGLLNPPGAGGGCSGLTNQDEFPASCQFYSVSSPWRTPIGPNPAYMSNSAAIIAHLLNGKNGDNNITTGKVDNPYDGFVDDAMPFYIGTASDPGVVIHPTGSWCATFGSIDGSIVHIPANAKPSQQNWPKGDQHLIVLDESGPTPVEYDFWADANAPPLTNGMSFPVGCAMRGDPYNGDGWQSNDLMGGTATAAGNLSLGSSVRISELQAGLNGIRHALSIQSACTYGAHIPPARVDGGLVKCNDDPLAGNTPPMGARYWWDEDCPTIAARTRIGAPSKALLCALHTYGAFEVDTNDNSSGLSISFAPESPSRYLSLGNPDVVTNYMVQNAPNTGYGCRNACYQFDLLSVTAIDVEAHLHILAP